MSATEARTSARPKKQVQPFQLYLTAFLAEPVTFEHAMNKDDAKNWKKAMIDELNSHHENNTWTLSELPSCRKDIQSKWVFNIKDDGENKRFKARLIAKGYSQRYGIDYKDTFSPVVRATTTLRTMFALAVKWNMHQMDAITAFLQGDLQEKISMIQPEGFEDGSNRAYRLIFD